MKASPWVKLAAQVGAGQCCYLRGGGAEAVRFASLLERAARGLLPREPEPAAGSGEPED